MLVALAMMLALVPSALAGEKYLAGSPELSAAVAGTNEFSPGDDVTISVRLQNSGLNEFKFVQSGIINRDDLPNTAKLVSVTLDPGNSPLVVKSDPQMIGDLAGGSTALVNFNVKIPRDAAAGTYVLPLYVDYTYLREASQYGSDTIQYIYRDSNETLELPVKIKPELQFEIMSSDTEHINSGTEGYLTLVIKNTGTEDAKRAIIKIARNDASPVIPSDSSVYIGDLPVGADAAGKFRISVNKDADDQTYPLDVYVNYENTEGDTVDTERTTIGIPVGEAVDFTIVSDPVEIVQGTTKVVTIRYENTGGATVYSARARISVVDPFTCSDDTAFLGTIAPGETKDASFEVTAEGDATPKEYGIDSEIRYRDALDNSQVSDPMQVPVLVLKNPGIVGILGNPLIIGIVVVGMIGAGYAVHRRYRRN